MIPPSAPGHLEMLVLKEILVSRRQELEQKVPWEAGMAVLLVSDLLYPFCKKKAERRHVNIVCILKNKAF